MGMKFRIEILMDNEAFADQPMTEVARILRLYAQKIEENGDMGYVLHDINGNAVGVAMIGSTSEIDEAVKKQT